MNRDLKQIIKDNQAIDEEEEKKNNIDRKVLLKE
jgi:hypothetical protein